MRKLLFLFVFLPFTIHAQSIISTIAGSGSGAYSGDGGPAIAAGLSNPSGVAYDNAGNLYISDYDHNVIRKVTPAGVISTICGTGAPGYSGDGGPAIAATLNGPLKIHIDAANNIYFGDFMNSCIRKINAAGIISTVAGNGTSGYSGDGGPATAASMLNCSGIAFDATGNMYIADYNNARVRKVTPAGIISTFAGTGTPGYSGDSGPAINAQLFGPFGLAIDNLNNLYIADASNHRVRIVYPSGIINTFAGMGTPVYSGDGGPAAAAGLNNPAGVTIAPDGSLYIADQFNYRTRKVSPTGIISTYAACGINGFAGDGGPALLAKISNSNEVALSATGDLVIADDINNRVRKITTVEVCDTISLVDTIRTCTNTTVTLPASVGGSSSIIDIRWTPSAGVSDTTILAPTLSVGTSSVMEYVTVHSILPSATNLVVNGDFSAGNTGFGSSYTYTPGPSSILNEGFYSVYNDPNLVHSGFTSFPDHTTGTGNMLIINGAGTPVDFWCETITVTPNTDYDFSAWFANCSTGSTGINSPILQFKINGVLLGSPTTLSSAPGAWNSFQSIWNSGTSTSANICISNLVVTTAGNDFVVDDIKFRPYCTAHDSVYVKVTPYDTTFIRHDTAVCASISVTLYAPNGYTADTFSNGSSATSINATAAGTYWVTSFNNCSRRIDTFHITYYTAPTVNLGSDIALCSGLTVTLSSTQPTGSTYLWSTGSTANPSITVTTSGNYWLAVTRNGCVGRDTVNVTFSPHAIVDLGPDTANCDGNLVVLQSSAAYTAPTYLWNTGATTASINALVTGTYWLQVTDLGCPGTDTINITIVYDTLHLLNRDTAICLGQVVPVLASANPAATYHWLPTAGIGSSSLIAPLITPDTSAMYYVTVNMAGCPPKVDSFYIDVQPYPQFYLGGNRSVCAFDTLHMHAQVSPGWFTGYSYSWVPATFLDNSNTATVVYTAGATQNYILTVSSSAGCTGIDSSLITVQAGNFASVVGSLEICPHDSVQLTASGGATYQWYPSANLSSPTSSAPWASPIATTTYSLIATSAVGCTDTVTVLVTVWPTALISIDDSVTLYPGESVHLSPITNCSSFLWFPVAGLSNPYISDPTATPDVSTQYFVYGITEQGCKAVDSINVNIAADGLIALPNAFTPGTGTNNTLSLLKRGYASLNYFRVFNRWGNMVFETTNLSQGWDGTYKGEAQPFGVYVYEIQAVDMNGKVINKHGNVTLLR